MATARGELIPTRESLLSRIRNAEDGPSWQEFFETYWKLIYSTARKAGLGDAEAQDIVQETVISVARNIEGFKYDPAVCSFKHWMLQLTRWRIANQFKKRQLQQRTQPSAPGGWPASPGSGEADDTATVERIPDPAGVDLEAIWDQEWQKGLLEAAMQRLQRQVDPAHLQIFDLYCLQEWPAQTVAQTLGVSIGRVYLAKHRVGRLLKREIQALKRELG